MDRRKCGKVLGYGDISRQICGIVVTITAGIENPQVTEKMTTCDDKLVPRRATGNVARDLFR